MKVPLLFLVQKIIMFFYQQEKLKANEERRLSTLLENQII